MGGKVQSEIPTSHNKQPLVQWALYMFSLIPPPVGCQIEFIEHLTDISHEQKKEKVSDMIMNYVHMAQIKINS